ncbi:undecaprenyldiphospho-muramoylpentapeptide beta-N-acetylglucosaminyltransferase [soil metagenome]
MSTENAVEEVRDKRILFVGGGTMGHIAPLVAVMEEVARQDSGVQLSYAGLLSDLTSPALDMSGLDFARHAITAGKLNRFATHKHLGELFKFGQGFSDAMQLMKDVKPDIVFCKGGFVSVPVALVAKVLKVPVYSHESDVVPGLANRVLAKISRKIFTAYPVKVYTRLPQRKLEYVGQPVRKSFFSELAFPTQVGEDAKLSLELPLIFVTGSQGSRTINNLIADNWEVLLKEFQIVQQCGHLDYTKLLERKLELPKASQDRLHLLPSVTDMAPLLQHAELVVSRAGGIIAELAASRAASILIPLSNSAQNHQWENAQVLGRVDAAVVLNEKILSASELLAVIQELHASEKQRSALREKIGHFAKPEAASEIAKRLLAAVK